MTFWMLLVAVIWAVAVTGAWMVDARKLATLQQELRERSVELLTPKQAAARLHVCPSTIVRRCKAGELDHVKVGRQYRVYPRAVR